MSVLLYAAPWLLWIAAFFLLEANGLRNSHDRWPTLSQLWKGWEDHRLATAPTTGETIRVPVRTGGAVRWTWQRWATCAGLPLLALALEGHWVWELY